MSEAARDQDPFLGKILQDRYRIIRKIGEGGMGAIYEGEHLVIKKRVAIKCLHAQYARTPELVARFRQEAHAASSIGHEHIIEVTDMGRAEDGSVFMVMEYLEGRDWDRDLEASGPQPLGKSLRIFAQVCAALDAAHEKGVIHRDLKPENIFLTQRDTNPDFVKLLDFGISKIRDSVTHTSGMTQTGTTLGTPYYMSPEQAHGDKDLDGRADQYALGVVLFRILTGVYPLDDEAYPMLVLKICSEPPPLIRKLRPDLPAKVEKVIDRMLAKDREDRFPNCRAAAAALQEFFEVEQPGVVIVKDARPKRSSLEKTLRMPSSRRPAWLSWKTGLGVLILALGGLGAYLITRPPAEEVVQVDPLLEDQHSEADHNLPQESAQNVRFEVISAAGEALPAAAIRLDGARVSNPYQGVHTDDGERHEVAISLSGYAPLTEEIRFAEGTITFTLQPLGADEASEGEASEPGESEEASGATMSATAMSRRPTMEEGTRALPGDLNYASAAELEARRARANADKAAQARLAAEEAARRAREAEREVLDIEL